MAINLEFAPDSCLVTAVALAQVTEVLHQLTQLIAQVEMLQGEILLTLQLTSKSAAQFKPIREAFKQLLHKRLHVERQVAPQKMVS
jgi:hypothetical protein